MKTTLGPDSGSNRHLVLQRRVHPEFSEFLECHGNVTVYSKTPNNTVAVVIQHS
jgi:hypothetical protein